jgi:dihydroxycyclohexadiene carboxylate dehydrogenase
VSAVFTDRFAGKVVVVTGAAQGLGEAVATRAAREGAPPPLVDRSDLVHEVAGKLAAEGAQTIGLTTDLERYLGASTAMAAARNRFGRIDVLINNVGGTIWAKPYAEYAEAEIEAEIRRSLFPTLWCCRAVLPTMVAQGRGVIVNVSSVATRGLNRVPYAAAKGGVNALTASLAWEYAEHGIRVVATAPGGIDAPPRKIPRGTVTEQTDQQKAWYQAIVEQTVSSSLLHRYGTLDEEVAPILFLASDEASYITGTRLPVAGGDLG